jgi:hypothetical protein
MPASIAWLRAQALRALGLDPLNIAALRQATGQDGNLSQLRKAALRAHGIDPFDQAAMQRVGAGAPTMPPPKPKRPRAKGTARGGSKKLARPFSDFIKSGCKNLQLAAKVLGIEPKPPLRKATLRAAWIALIRENHPDKGGTVELAQAINTAYQLLVKFAN